MCSYPFFEVTPPGAAPGPPVKPGPVFVASRCVISNFPAALPSRFAAMLHACSGEILIERQRLLHLGPVAET